MIHLNVHNEVVLRCHGCGFVGTALDMLRQQGDLNWEKITAALEEEEIFGDKPVPAEWIERARVWEQFADFFEDAKAMYRRWIETGNQEHAQFGEVGISFPLTIEKALPGVRLVASWGKCVACVIDLKRSVLGLPLQAVVRNRLNGRVLASYQFQPPEPMMLMVPDWALYRDWTDRLMVCTDVGVATALQKELTDSDSDGPPIGYVHDCRAPIADELPFREVFYLPADHEGAEFALAFAQGGVKAKVWNEDAITMVADQIVSQTAEGTNAVAYLNAILEKPWISRETADRLTRAVADRIGRSLDSLIARSGLTTQVLPCQVGKTTYLCRNGIYVKTRSGQDCRPCSNFSLRIEESAVGDDRTVTHRVRLHVGGQLATFNVSEREFQQGGRLLEMATGAAVQAGLPAMPVMSDPADVKRLPAIVKSTQLKPAFQSRQPAKLGFVDGVFHGPNFTVSPKSVQFREMAASPAKGAARWMLPESPDLTVKANELATWIDGLEEEQQRTVGVVLYAALAWLHRGSRGLNSFLLLPSVEHLELLGQLTGLVPIEVGRSRGEQPGVPRLMKSFYWKKDQFKRQGRIVAAVEDPNRRIDPKIPVIVHRQPEGEFLEPPSCFLALLAFACLGSRDLEAAIEKLAALCDCPDLQKTLERQIRRGDRYFVTAGEYLGRFMAAVKRNVAPDEVVIRSRGRSFLKREVVNWLNHQHGYDFQERRLIREFREDKGVSQPARFGRDRIPVFPLIGLYGPNLIPLKKA